MQQILCTQIARMLETSPYCIVPENYLLRVWPIENDRAWQVKQFAHKNNWQVRACPGQQGVIITKRFKACS